MFNKNQVFFLLGACFLILLPACGAPQSQAPASHVQEFRKPRINDEAKKPANITLRNLAAKIPGLKPASALEVFSEISDENHRYHVKVFLGKLTKEQCEMAKLVYADGWKTGLSGVDCGVDANVRNFLLDDFLSPVMQATLKHSFQTESKILENRAATQAEQARFGLRGGWYIRGQYAGINCWSMAYEVARRTSGVAPQLTRGVLDAPDVDKIFSSSQYTRDRFGKVSLSQLQPALEKWGVRFGDLLLVRDRDPATGKEVLVHAAIFVDHGLVYERVGNFASELPFRIARVEDIFRQYPSARYEVKAVLKDFPHARQIPGVSLKKVGAFEGVIDDRELVLSDLSLRKSPSRPYELPSEAFRPVLR